MSGLTWKDIDVENGVITVDHAAVYFAGKMNKSKKRYISTPKTDTSIRKIPMAKEVCQALKEVKQYRHDNGIYCATEIDRYTTLYF